MINVGLSSLPSNLLGNPLDFSAGFGPNPITTTRNNIPPVSFGSLDIIFDSIEVTATGNSIDFLFTESTLFGSAALILTDATIAQTLNNDSITSGFHLQSSVSAVPVPASIWLMVSGLLGFFGCSRKNQIKK